MFFSAGYGQSQYLENLLNSNSSNRCCCRCNNSNVGSANSGCGCNNSNVSPESNCSRCNRALNNLQDTTLDVMENCSDISNVNSSNNSCCRCNCSSVSPTNRCNRSIEDFRDAVQNVSRSVDDLQDVACEFLANCNNSVSNFRR